jgi:hypothetical protein
MAQRRGKTDIAWTMRTATRAAFGAAIHLLLQATHARLRFVLQEKDFVHDRQPVRDGKMLQSFSDAPADERTVRGFTLDDHAERDDHIHTAAKRHFLHDQWNLEGARCFVLLDEGAGGNDVEFALHMIDEPVHIILMIQTGDDCKGAPGAHLART